MAKKQKEEVELRPQEAQPRQLSNEEKELINAAIKIAIERHKEAGALAVTLVTLARRVQMTTPINDLKTIIEYIRGAKEYRIITIHDKIGNYVLPIEVVLLYNSVEEVIEEFEKKKVNTIKVVDAELDSITDYITDYKR